MLSGGSDAADRSRLDAWQTKSQKWHPSFADWIISRFWRVGNTLLSFLWSLFQCEGDENPRHPHTEQFIVAVSMLRANALMPNPSVNILKNFSAPLQAYLEC